MSAEGEFATFVAQYDAVLRRSLHNSIHGLPNDVDDVMQDGFAKMWEQFSTWPEDPVSRLKFARKLLNNASVDLMRSRWGRNGNRRDAEVIVDVAGLGAEVDHEQELATNDLVMDELRRLLGTMHTELEREDDGELERRWAALNALLPALKDIEREVLLAHHPAGADRKATDVAAQLGITHGQARTHYHEALAVIKPLMAHALAPGLDNAEAAAVLEYSAGGPWNEDGKPDKRGRGRMKRHLQHCDQCRAFADAERAVIGTGAKLILPLPLIIGATKAATGFAAIAAGGGAVAAGIELGAGSGAIAAGTSALSGLAAKLVATAAAAAIASGAYAGLTKDEPKHGGTGQTPAAATAAPAAIAIADRTPAPTVAPAAVRTPSPAARKRARRRVAQRRRDALEHPSAIATVDPALASTAAPTVAPASTAPAIPTVAPSSSAAGLGTDPPADKPSSSFSQEFVP